MVPYFLIPFFRILTIQQPANPDFSVALILRYLSFPRCQVTLTPEQGVFILHKNIAMPAMKLVGRSPFQVNKLAADLRR